MWTGGARGFWVQTLAVRRRLEDRRCTVKLPSSTVPVQEVLARYGDSPSTPLHTTRVLDSGSGQVGKGSETESGASLFAARVSTVYG